ncbi:MAG: aminotransferase class IV [Ilumatobacteraceae bacterium]
MPQRGLLLPTATPARAARRRRRQCPSRPPPRSDERRTRRGGRTPRSTCSPTLHYGTGVFEGIRAYATAEGPAIFRLTEHTERLFRSAKILGMEIPYSVDEIVAATKATVASTGLDSCYVRPIAYFGYGDGPQHDALHRRRVHRLLAVGRVSRRMTR